MKKTFKIFSILILVLTILIMSKNEQKNSYAYVNKLIENGNFEVTQEKNSIKFLSNKKYYKLTGDACEKKDYKIKLPDKIELNENYLCVVEKTDDEQSINGSKEVEIEFKNLNYGYLYVMIYEKDKNGDRKSSNRYEIYPWSNTIKHTYKYNYDYEIIVEDYNNLYENVDIIDNLKTSELNSTETIKRTINLKSTLSLDQDLNLIQISDKIKSNSNIKYDTSYINYSLISPQTVSYKETQETKKINLNTSSYYYFADSYSFDKNKGLFTLNSPKNFRISSTSPIGKYTYLSTYSGSGSYSYIYKINSGPDENGKYDATYISRIEDSDDSGLYSYNTSAGTTYFYRGVVENNYVKFGGYIWRIIRINEDGSIRMILDGDIGSVKWNDSSKYMYYTGYAYGNIKYQPLTSQYTSRWGERNIMVNIDPSKKYCYSDTYTFDMRNNKYQLSGNVICKFLTNGSNEMQNKYTLFKESRYDKSTEITKLSIYYTRNQYNSAKYEVAESETTVSQDSKTRKYTYYYSDKYEIVNGLYKLVNPQKMEYDYRTYRQYKNTLKGKYILKGDYNWSLPKNTTARKMFKISELYSESELKGQLFIEPVYNYVNSNNNPSNPKKLLDSWYNEKLSYYGRYISYSTFCNDTSGSKNTYNNTFTINGATNRLNSYKGITPTFDCTGPFEFGGSYRNSIGMITADEMVFAGASKEKINNKYYLAYYKPYWTMTPANNNSMFASTIGEYNQNTENINAFRIEKIDAATASYAQLYVGDSSFAVRPVINIYGSNYTYNKNAGTKGNPYEIITDNKILSAYRGY